MNQTLAKIDSFLFKPNHLGISNYIVESESQEYGACRYEINGKKIISRNAKITPKKVGQFVTVWKRSSEGITQPFEASDNFDLLVINVRNEDQLGQFVFPKSTLTEKGIITSDKKEGKRAFRVYPPWDQPTNSQATISQKWQIEYFIKSDDSYETVMNCYQHI